MITRTYTPRYVRTRNGRKRRLTLGHVAAQQRARRLAGDGYTRADLLETWHGSGWAGVSPSGVGVIPFCIRWSWWERRCRADVQ
jgi:hypothetical protein